MKKNNFKNIFPFMFFLLAFNSCRDECYYYMEDTVYEEILANADDVKNSFAVVEDFKIKSPGNIYTYNQYLFVAEKNEGIHILDNSNPATPVPLKFIKLKGNSDFAVSNNILLADNGPDLLSINLSDLEHIKIDKRTEGTNTTVMRPNNKILAGYQANKVKRKVDCGGNNNGMSNTIQSFGASAVNTSAGKGGSLAKFAISGNYLYMVNTSALLPIEISNPSNPVKKLSLTLFNPNVETVFPYKNFLYFGTSSGVLIYDIGTSPETPDYKNTLTHALGCDPVVVSNDYCFSTVRNNTACRNGNTVNLLYLYNVADVNLPKYINRISMKSPYGLGVKGNLLFICEGINGLSVYNWDASNGNVVIKHTYADIHASDVIVNGNTLIVTAENGLFQFDCTDPDNILYLSTLSNF